jgi:hypothetical protein
MDEQARQRRRAEAHRRVRRLRLMAAGGGVVLLALGSIIVVVAGDGRDSGRQAHTGGIAARRRARPITLFGGGRQIFPAHRVVAYYGAPGDARLGILGAAPPDRIARLLKHQARAYARLGRPVLPALELVATVATRSPGADGMYRARQPAAVVRRYLNAARRARALLILDLQPGRSEFLTEARVYESFLRDPDVSLALDPEWQLAPGQTPGQQIGSTDAATINQVSASPDRTAVASSPRSPFTNTSSAIHCSAGNTPLRSVGLRRRVRPATSLVQERLHRELCEAVTPRAGCRPRRAELSQDYEHLGDHVRRTGDVQDQYCRYGSRRARLAAARP